MRSDYISNTNISGMRLDFMLNEYYIYYMYISTFAVHPFDLASICHPLPLLAETGLSTLVSLTVPRWWKDRYRVSWGNLEFFNGRSLGSQKCGYFPIKFMAPPKHVVGLYVTNMKFFYVSFFLSNPYEAFVWFDQLNNCVSNCIQYEGPLFYKNMLAEDGARVPCLTSLSACIMRIVECMI